MNWKHTVLLAIAVACMATVSMAQSNDFNPFRGQAGFVYTETNGAQNAVSVFNRAANGSLTLAATVPQADRAVEWCRSLAGRLALSQDGRWLFVANEGDGSISVMERTASGLTAVGTVSTAALSRSALRSAGTWSMSSTTIHARPPHSFFFVR